MKEFLKKIAPIMAFIAIIASVSIICISLNNLIFVSPRDSALLGLNGEIVKVLEKHRGDIYLLDSDIENIYNSLERQSEITKEIYLYFQNAHMKQTVINKGLYELLSIQTEHIIELEKKVKTLEKRHMELLRAHAVLQKKNWKKEKFYE